VGPLAPLLRAVQRDNPSLEIFQVQSTRISAFGQLEDNNDYGFAPSAIGWSVSLSDLPFAELGGEAFPIPFPQSDTRPVS